MSENTNNTYKDFLGHPRALWMLFSSEFWERFSFYGMRAILAPYVAMAFFAHMGDQAEAQASLTYGGYSAMIYMTGIMGGYVADKILGYQRSIMLGGAMMATGLFMLLNPNMDIFLLGLAVMVVGNGMFKPNISTMVGKLYTPEDPRRDSGFTIFYMGINAGALIAPLVCGLWIGQVYGFKWGFFAAGIGMIFGLMMFQMLKGWLGNVGKAPAERNGTKSFVQVIIGAAILIAPTYLLLSKSDVLGIIMSLFMLILASYFIYSGIKSGNKEQLHRYIAMLILFVANMFFWALFEQAGSSLNFFARDYVQMPVLPLIGELNFTAFQSANPIFILLLAPLFAMMWPKLDKMKINPSIPRKFSFGLAGVGLGFFILVMGINHFIGENGRVPWEILTLCYMIHTMGELCLSPIGLSMVTKLALPHETGLAMGGWFVSIATGNYLAGRIASIASGGSGHGDAAGSIEGYYAVFHQLFVGGLIIGAFFFLVAPLVNKLMHGVK